MFSLRFTFILLCFLFVPFLLKYKTGGYLEPYPSIILPSGAGKTAVNQDQKNIGLIELYAQKVNGEWELLEERELFYPIPVQYHSFIISNDFCLKDTQLDEGKLTELLKQLNILRRRNVTIQEKGIAKKWLSKRIEKQGFSGSAIKVLQKCQTLLTENGKVLKEEIVEQKIIHLDQELESPFLE